MKKKEWVYRQILYEAAGKKTRLTQLGLSKELGISLCTVNNALKPLAQMGIISIRRMGFELLEPKKLLLFWASVRNLQKDVVYSTRADMGIAQIEKNMPDGVIYTAYSGYKFRLKSAPADYSEVYVYAGAEALKEIEKRFARKEGPQNLFVLKTDCALEKIAHNKVAPLEQIYADLWNLRQWYAKEFTNALEGGGLNGRILE